MAEGFTGFIDDDISTPIFVQEHPKDRNRKQLLINFLDENSDQNITLSDSHMDNNRKLELEIEKRKLDLGRDRIRYEHELRIKQLDIELAKENILENCKKTEHEVPVKLKLQPYDHKSRDDILTYLSEFEAIASKAKWTTEMMVLQLRTLLTEEAKEVSQIASNNYSELRKVLVDRFGRRKHQYFPDLLEVRQKEHETYRGLMARITQCVNRFIGEDNPKERLCEEFFLKALSPAQAQWIRRNKGQNSVVDAAEGYIMPANGPRIQPRTDREMQIKQSMNVNRDKQRCYNCNRPGHLAKDYRKPKVENVGELKYAFYYENEILKREWESKDGTKGGNQIVLPRPLRKSVLELAHDNAMSGHLGVSKCKRRILNSFYWPGVFADVTKHCRSCDLCQKTSSRSNIKAPTVKTPVINEPFVKIAIGIVGPMSRTKKGNKYK